MSSRYHRDLLAPLASTSPRVMALLVIVIGLATYHNSLDGAGVFDDSPNVALSVGMLDRIGQNLTAPKPRHLGYWSILGNYLVGGTRVRGYHQFNRLVHVLAALALFGLTRRTLTFARANTRPQWQLDWMAFSISLLWMVHPLQTQSVTYMIQRLESMMGLFYFLCLYCLCRGAGAARAGWWYLASIVAFCCGAASKEVIVTAPVLMLLYDRAYLSSSWRALARARWCFYSCLAVPFALLLMYLTYYLVPGHRHSVGLGHPWISPWMYLRTQSAVILHYLNLVVWPKDLCLDYCWPVMSVRETLVPGVIVLGLVGASLFAMFRWPRVGFPLLAFFIVLAPTSSFIPINDLAMEHRMYVPLACAATAMVVALGAVLGAAQRKWEWKSGCETALLLGAVSCAAVPLAIRTVHRNDDYRTVMSLWQRDVAVRPTSFRAQYNLGVELLSAGRVDEGLDQIQLGYELACVHSGSRSEMEAYLASFSAALAHKNRSGELLERLRRARERQPAAAHIRWALGVQYLMERDVLPAIDELRAAVALDPEFVEARATMATAMLANHQPDAALSELRAALQLDRDNIALWDFLAWVLATHPDDAVRNGKEAVRIAEEMCLARGSQQARSWGTLAGAYAEVGRFDDAVRAGGKSVTLCERPGDDGNVARAREQLEVYRSRRPYRMAIDDLLERTIEPSEESRMGTGSSRGPLIARQT